VAVRLFISFRTGINPGMNHFGSYPVPTFIQINNVGTTFMVVRSQFGQG